MRRWPSGLPPTRGSGGCVRGIVASPSGSVGLLEARVAGEPAADLPPERLDRAPAGRRVAPGPRAARARTAHRNLDLSQVLVSPDGRALLRGFEARRWRHPIATSP